MLTLGYASTTAGERGGHKDSKLKDGSDVTKKGNMVEGADPAQALPLSP